MPRRQQQHLSAAHTISPTTRGRQFQRTFFRPCCGGRAFSCRTASSAFVQVSRQKWRCCWRPMLPALLSACRAPARPSLIWNTRFRCALSWICVPAFYSVRLCADCDKVSNLTRPCMKNLLCIIRENCSVVHFMQTYNSVNLGLCMAAAICTGKKLSEQLVAS